MTKDEFTLKLKLTGFVFCYKSSSLISYSYSKNWLMLNCMQSRVDDEIRVRTNQLGKEESLETFLNSDLAMQYITERIKGNAHE